MILVSLMSLAWAEAPLPPAPPPLEAGEYVMVVEVESLSKVPVAGTTSVTTRSLLRVQLVQDAVGWTQRQEVCAVDIATTTRATTILPQAFVEAVPVTSYPVQLIRDGEGWRYAADPGPNHIGFDPGVTGGAVPRKKGDPGVVDFEGDGHPGATVLLDVPVIGSVRMYVAQKGWSRYAGTIGTDGVISGGVETLLTEQRTLGASLGLFAVDPQTTPVPESSRFRIEPVTTTASCKALAAGWNRRFTVPQVSSGS